MRKILKPIFGFLWVTTIIWALITIINSYRKSGLQPVPNQATNAFLARFHPKAAMLVEVIDLDCSACQLIHPSLLSWQVKHSTVPCEIVHFPLRMHENAMNAAIATELARSEGKFQLSVDDFMSGRSHIDPKSIRSYLSKIDPSLHDDSVKRSAAKARIKNDIKFCESMNVVQTPSIFGWNGRELYIVRSLPGLDQLLN